MGVISIIGKIVLVVVNIILLLMSMAMIAIGIIILKFPDVIKKVVDNLEDELKEALQKIHANVDTENFSISEFLTPLAYFMIGMGVLIGVLSLLGCIGACCTVQCILILYVIVTSIVLLAQVTLTILIYTDSSALDKAVKPYITDTLHDYAGLEGNDSKTLAWNAIMNFEKCCGVDDYTDFHNLTHWPAKVKGQDLDLKTPVMCCKEKSTDLDCALNPTDQISNWKTGCYPKLFKLVTEHSIVLTVIIVALVSQFILIFFAVWIACTMNNKIDVL